MVRRIVACAGLLVVGLAVVACGGGGGGGGSGSSAGASGSGSQSGGTFSGTDTTPPSLTVDPASGPGAMLAGPLAVFRGTATDAESGLAGVTVNGTAAVINGNAWEARLSLPAGTHHIEVRAVDRQNNVARETFSVIYADALTDPAQPVADAAKLRLARGGFADLSALASQAAAQASLGQSLVGRQVHFQLLGQSFVATVRQVSFGSPTVTLSPTANGLRAVVAIDRPHLTLDIPGIGNGTTLDADRATADTTVRVDVAAGGGWQASVTAVTVQVLNPRSNQPAINVALGLQLLEILLEDAIRRELPPAIVGALTSYVVPRTFQALGTSFTVEVRPSAIVYSDQALEVVLATNLTSPATGSSAAPGRPTGSISRRATSGSSLPALSGPDTHEVYAWIAEDAINRGLFAVWESGALDVTVDQQFLAQLGLQLPFNFLDGRIFALFFPQVAAMMPPTGPVPLAFRLQHDLPPVVLVGAGSSALAASLGELRFSMAMDFGGGWTDVLTMVLHLELEADLAIRNQQIIVRLGQQLALYYRGAAESLRIPAAGHLQLRQHRAAPARHLPQRRAAAAPAARAAELFGRATAQHRSAAGRARRGLPALRGRSVASSGRRARGRRRCRAAGRGASCPAPGRRAFSAELWPACVPARRRRSALRAVAGGRGQAAVQPPPSEPAAVSAAASACSGAAVGSATRGRPTVGRRRGQPPGVLAGPGGPGGGGTALGLGGRPERHQHHRHLAAVEPVVAALHLGHVLHGRGHLVEHLDAVFHVAHLAPPEHHVDAAALAFFQELAQLAHLHLDIVVAGVRPEADLADLAARLLAARQSLLLFFLELLLAVVEDTADRWAGVRSDLHQVEVALPRCLQGIRDGDDPHLLAVRSDQPHGAWR
ncbi:MAG: hypothetical protein KatS3mg102_2915 [Planctomycetota bacterium]|nr:MAG: hypothetical protein KatS3mg102_2915 [Planctomycetota bacterium]